MSSLTSGHGERPVCPADPDDVPFRAYWQHFLREHADPRTRILSYLGVVLSLLSGVVLLRFGLIFLLPVALLPGVALNRFSRWLTGNAMPRTRSQPEWAVLANLELLGLWLIGKLPAELRRAGVASS